MQGSLQKTAQVVAVVLISTCETQGVAVLAGNSVMLGCIGFMLGCMGVRRTQQGQGEGCTGMRQVDCCAGVCWGAYGVMLGCRVVCRAQRPRGGGGAQKHTNV